MKNKVFPSFDAAVADIPDGATIMMHTMTGAGGVAQNLILALRRRGVRNLTIICCSSGAGTGIQEKLGLKPFVTPNFLVENKQVRRAITTWSTSISRTIARGAGEVNPLQGAVLRGEVEWVPTPMGVLTEQIRAGAVGLGGFYSPVGVGTVIEKGREKRLINGREYLFYEPLRADFSFVRAHRADTFGNLIYRGTARTFNPLMAMAGNVTIVETEQLVEIGGIDPENVVTSGVFVDRIVEIPKEQ